MLNSNQHSISKTELATLIRKYWLVVMTVFLTGTIATWGFIGIYFTEMYETQVRLLVKLGPQNAATPDTVQRGQLMVQGVRVADINSEVEILSSRSLVETAVDRIGPEAFRTVDPVPESFVGEAKLYAKQAAREAKRLWNEFLIVTALKERLTEREETIVAVEQGVAVEPIRDSDILTLRVATTSPELSVQVAEVMLEEYFERRTTIRATSAGSQFFAERLAETESRLEDLNRERLQIRELWGFQAPSEERAQYLNQLAEIESEIVGNEADIVRMQRQVELMQTRSGDLPEMVEKELVRAHNPTIMSIQERLTELRVERTQIVSRYLPTSETVRKIESEIAELERAIADEDATIVSAVTSEANPTRRNFESEIENSQVRIQSFRRRNDFLRGPEQELVDTIKRITDGYDEYLRADLDYEVARQEFLAYSERLEEAQMNEQLDSLRVANVVTVAPAAVPAEPSYPNKVFLMEIGMAVSLMLGLGLAVLLETTEDRILDERSVLAMENVVYLGSIDFKRSESA